MRDLATKVVNCVTTKLKGGTRVHVIVDRYCDYNIKTRCSHKAQVSREHQLCLGSPLPPEQITLTVTKTTQLIDSIFNALVFTVEQSNLTNSL